MNVDAYEKRQTYSFMVLQQKIQLIADLLQDGKFKTAIDSLDALKQEQRNIPLVWNLYGYANEKLKNYHDAADAYRKSLQLSPNEAAVHYNLGNVFLAQKQYEKAASKFRTALGLNNALVDAKINLGMCYWKMSNLQKAKAIFEESLNADPTKINAQLNLATVNFQLGEVAQSELGFERLGKLTSPNNAAVIAGLSSIYLLRGRIVEAKLEVSKITITGGEDEQLLINAYILNDVDCKDQGSNYADLLNVLLSTIKNRNLPKLATYLMIAAYTRNDIALCRRIQTRIKEMLSVIKLEEFYAKKDIIFIAAFENFVSQLLNFEASGSKAKQIITLVGDSHCLSFANRDVIIGNIEHNLKSKVITGTKAYHIGQATGQQFGLLCHYISQLPASSKIILCAGEIDCRANEGIIKASQKLGKSIEELCRSTVENYVSQVSRIRTLYQLDFYLMTIHAPLSSELESKIKVVHDQHIIALFNELLIKEAMKFNIPVIDLYDKTKDENSLGNPKDYCDNRHLSPTSIHLLQNAISSVRT